MGYQTIGRFAIGRRAFGFSSGFAVNVGNDDPGPHRIRACSSGDAIDTAWGMASSYLMMPGKFQCPQKVQFSQITERRKVECDAESEPGAAENI
jgi:hypothetical protein